MSTLRKIWPIFSVFVALLLGFQQCKELPAKQEAFFLNLNDTVDYVGIETCKQCHISHYNTFIQTGMGSSFGPATKVRSKALINQKPVYDAKLDMYYAAQWKGDSLKITEFRLNGRDTTYQRSVNVSHIIGSGHHTNSHFWMENGYVFQAPLTFYTQSGKWDLPPGFEETNTRFSRKIDIECMSCHNAMPAVQEGSINKFTKIPNGIDCERCHGPGELHVQLKMKGIIVDTAKEADRSIVNPARLPWELQVDVCQRCHLQGNNVLKPGKKFTDFRPGIPLSDVFDAFMPVASNGAFFMAGHAERLQLSACFKGSNKSYIKAYNPKLNLTCITCHNPHVSVRKTNIATFNNACKGCHNANTTKSKLLQCSKNMQARTSKNDNCVGCHMPSNGTGDIPHVTVHDHFIRKKYDNPSQPSVSKFELYAVNEKQPNKHTELQAYITWFEKFEAKTEYMQKAEGMLKYQEDKELKIHFYYANASWSEVIQLAAQMEKPVNDAWTCYRIAKAYDKEQQLGEALNWYAKASNAMKFNPDFAAEYANALNRSDRFSEALSLLKSVLAEQPSHELGNINAGVASFRLNRWAEAKKYWLHAVQLNPDNALTHRYLLELYQRVGETALAKQENVEIARINHRK